MKKISLLFLLVFTLPLGAQTLQLAEEHFPQEADFGKPFQAQFVLSHEPGAKVRLDPESLPKEFPVTAQTQEQTSPATTVYSLTVLPLTLKASTFTVTFEVPDSEMAPLKKEYPITVKEVQFFKDKKLREIRGPHVPLSWLMWLLIFALLAALLYAFYKWQHRNQDAAHTKLSVLQDTRPAHEIALSQINALIDSGLWENKQYKVFYLTLSDILREYLWRRFALDVSADTSVELLRRAKKMPQLEPLLPKLRDFLTTGDLVKFAKAVPSEQERNQTILDLESIVKQTTPKPAPEVQK